MKRYLPVNLCSACEFGVEIDTEMGYTIKKCGKYNKNLSFDEWGGFEKPEFCEIHGHERIIEMCIQCNQCFGFTDEKYCNKERKGIEDYYTIPEWCKLKKII